MNLNAITLAITRPGGVRAWDPRGLFGSGEQGVWYDPSDMTTLYQDAAGTTPVTAVEQPVGLMLDKSKGLVLGPELVTNGDGSSATGWGSFGGGLVISDGSVLTVTASGAYSGTSQALALVAGKTYQLVAVVRSVSGSGLDLRIDFNGVSQTTASTSFVTLRQVFTAVSAQSIKISSISAAGVVEIDNVSVRELPGNHAYQTVSTKRPVLSARVNLLTKTEAFDDAVWTKQSCTVARTTDPLGGNNAWTASLNAANAALIQALTAGALAVSGNKLRVYIKAGTLSTADLTIYEGGSGQYRATAASIISGAGTASITAGLARIIGLDANWTLVEVTISGVITTNTPYVYFYIPRVSASTATGTISFAFPDLRATNTGVNLPAYQRVNTATDYDTQGFPTYLMFDGIDDAMQTNSIDFTATDKMTVFAGVRKLGASGTNAILVEFGVGGSQGGFSFFAPVGFDQYAFLGNGSVYTAATQLATTTSSIYAAPHTGVLTGLGDIPADLNTLRINATQIATGTGDQGTGNFGNYPLYIGARAGTSLFFNGNLYNLIVRGAQSTAAQIESTEQWVNGKTAAF